MAGKAFVAGMLLALLTLLGWLLLPASPEPMPDSFELLPGRNLRGVAQDLNAQGLLRAPGLFALLGRLHPRASHLQAGSYALNGPVSPLIWYGRLFRGEAEQHAVTLVEGRTLAQVRSALAREAWLTHDLATLDDPALLQRLGLDLPVPSAHPTAEGLFLPETYFYPGKASDLQVLQRAAGALQRFLLKAWAGRAPDLPLNNPYEALILASIIERESARREERPQIAAVFFNRLRLGMRLQTDPTVIYGMGSAYEGHLHHADVQRDTPWNTYTRAGLPPTPIGLASQEALLAALHPASSAALYFVARGDGSHVFSQSLAAHQQAIEANRHGSD